MVTPGGASTHPKVPLRARTSHAETAATPVAGTPITLL